EIASLYEDHASALTDLMNDYELNAKYIDRKRGYTIYLKEAEKIAEFLSLIDGYQALLKFEDIRIVRDMRNSVNRLVNCETANLIKRLMQRCGKWKTLSLSMRKSGLTNCLNA